MPTTMNPYMADLLKRASQVLPNTEEMVLTLAKRVAELSHGASPYILKAADMSDVEVALREIIDRKIGPDRVETNETQRLQKLVDEIAAKRFPSLAGK